MTPASKSAVPGTNAPSEDGSVINLISNENEVDAFVAKIQAKPASPIFAPPGPCPSCTGGSWNGRTRTQMALNIFCHGMLPWEEEKEEGEGDKFDNDCCRTGSTPFGDHAERRSLSETETLGGTTAATKIATVGKKARKKRKTRGGSLSPNMYTFGAILTCAARDSNVDGIALMRILRTLEEGEEYPDVVPNHVIYSTVISACANCCAADTAVQVDHRDSIGNGMRRGIINDNIVDMALEMLNRRIRTQRGWGGKGVVGYNANQPWRGRAGLEQWRSTLNLEGGE
jgi:hypothetical protein